MINTYQLSGSETYRLMIYFAHSTLNIYSKTIVCNENMSINDFRNVNNDVIKRVYDEAKNLFNYELSYDQISRAIRVYFISRFNPKSVYETDVYQINE